MISSNFDNTKMYIHPNSSQYSFSKASQYNRYYQSAILHRKTLDFTDNFEISILDAPCGRMSCGPSIFISLVKPAAI